MRVFFCQLYPLLRGLAETHEELQSRKTFAALLAKEAKYKSLQAHEKQDIINELCALFIDEKYTLSCLRICRPIIIELVSRIVEGALGPYRLNTHEAISTSFSKILPFCPQAFGFVLEYSKNNPSLFARIQDGKEAQQDIEKIKTITETAYRYLRFNSAEFSKVWNWSPFFNLLSHQNERIQFIASECVSMLVNVSDEVRSMKKDVNSESLRKLQVEFYQSIRESESLEEMALLYNEGVCDIDSEQVTAALESRALVASNISSRLVDVCGILLPKTVDLYSEKRKESSFVSTPTTERNMRALVLSLCQRKPNLLQGLTGSGKTALIEELARLTENHNIIKIHVGDGTDGKVLLGTYVSTEVPGEFRWQPGPLTQAVVHGRWIVIEDLDLAPLDLLSILRPLLETRKLFIPERGEEIAASNGFQLFATQTLFGGGGRSQIASLLNNFWTKVVLEPLLAQN